MVLEAISIDEKTWLWRGWRKMTLTFQPFVYVSSLRLQRGSSRLRAQ